MSGDDHVLILVNIEGDNIKFLRSYISRESFNTTLSSAGGGMITKVSIPTNVTWRNIKDQCQDEGLNAECIKINTDTADVEGANGVILTTAHDLDNAKTYISKDQISISENDITGEMKLHSFGTITIETKSQKMFDTLFLFFGPGKAGDAAPADDNVVLKDSLDIYDRKNFILSPSIFTRINT